MSGGASRTAAALHARTRSVDLDTISNPLDYLGRDGFVWMNDDSIIVTSGIAIEVEAHGVAKMLGTIEGDPVEIIACGALPFSNSDTGSMIVPARVLRIDGRGTRVTEIASDVVAPDTTWSRVPQRFTVESRQDLATWDNAVASALALIDDGALDKVVLAREVLVTADEPFAIEPILTTLRATQPGCFIYCDRGFVGASPELLVRRAGRVVRSRPMAGTVTRQATIEADEATIATLRSSIKNNEEHQYVVDAILAVLHEHCDTLEASRPEPVRLTTVTHLTTTIDGILHARDGATALDLALAMHPTPAVGGTPQAAAVAAINKLEPFDRGRYAAPVGWVDGNGDGEFAIALRCAEIVGNQARLIAGAGIVAGRDPDDEWSETQAKLEPMLRALVRP